MRITATVPILPGAVVNQEPSCASYSKQAPRVLRDRDSDETANFRRQPRETLFCDGPQAQ